MNNSRQVIIQAALNLAVVKKWENVSLRKIANNIGYSTMKIYSDFGSKEELLYAIQKEGFILLSKAYQKAVEQADSSSLEQLFLAHVQFAKKYPAYYELMFDHAFSNCKERVTEDKRRACSTISGAIEALGTADSRTTFIHFFSLIEGFIKVTKDMPQPSANFIEKTSKTIVKNFLKGVQ